MPDLPRQYDEPDLISHICNVLDDYSAGILDGRDEAVDAILMHPKIKAAMGLVPVGKLGGEETAHPAAG